MRLSKEVLVQEYERRHSAKKMGNRQVNAGRWPPAELWRPTLKQQPLGQQYWDMSIAAYLSFFCLLIHLMSCGARTSESLPNNLPAPVAIPTVSAQTEEPKKPDQARPLDKNWGSSFRLKTISVSEKHKGYCPYQLSAEYPQLASSKRNVKEFNRWIKRKILRDVARFRRLELNAEPRARKEGKRLITEGLELTFDLYYANERLISLRLTHDVMAAGQMHPIAYYETINYDLNKHRPLRARDVFRRGYLPRFSSYSRKWLQDTYEISDKELLMQGTQARVENFLNWNIVPDGILISFEDYQVGSHSFGQPELIVPYSFLRRLLRRQSLLEQFVRRYSQI